ncbi:MAG TPA: gluconate 5-dehydrogenase [Blastocatellia bacterium]|nr:gluconate 5-dehydrogenase [Blastocatellia bacterium]
MKCSRKNASSRTLLAIYIHLTAKEAAASNNCGRIVSSQCPVPCDPSQAFGTIFACVCARLAFAARFFARASVCLLPPSLRFMSKNVLELFDLAGKTAIVTGGSRGIGLEMAEALAEAGARLVLCARRAEWLDASVDDLKNRGFDARGRICDVSKPDEIDEVVRAAVKETGSVDILVNNAGISWGAMPEDMPLEKWQKVIDVNLTGCFLFAQSVGRQMLRQGSGSIINIASIAGITSSANGPFYAGYVASKAGLIGLTRELAASWGRRGVRVNAIAPGPVNTPMLAAVPGAGIEAFARGTIVGRVAEPTDMAAVVCFLSDPKMSGYITGQVMPANGGLYLQ